MFAGKDEGYRNGDLVGTGNSSSSNPSTGVNSGGGSVSGGGNNGEFIMTRSDGATWSTVAGGYVLNGKIVSTTPEWTGGGTNPGSNTGGAGGSSGGNSGETTVPALLTGTVKTAKATGGVIVEARGNGEPSGNTQDSVMAYAVSGPTPPKSMVSVIFVASGMEDQAKIRAKIYGNVYDNIFVIESAKDFITKWNKFFQSCIEEGIDIDVIEIISHGNASGPIGKDEHGTANATGRMIFGLTYVWARDNDLMGRSDRSLSEIVPVTAKELNVNACNSANPDVYNILYGIMQKVDARRYTGWDGGTAWGPSVGIDIDDHVRGGGDHINTEELPWYAFGDNWYLVKRHQETFWTYVSKVEINGIYIPTRERVEKRTFVKLNVSGNMELFELS